MSNEKIQSETEEKDSENQPDLSLANKDSVEALVNKNREILGEKKKLQKALQDLQTKMNSEYEKKLAEDGKLKEALDLKDKRLKELEMAQEKLLKYEEKATLNLKEILKKMPESIQKLIEGFNGDLSEKLQYAEQLKLEFTKKNNSIGSERPGGNVNIDINLDDIKKEKDNVKKAEMMFALKQKDPQAYQRL